MKDRVAVVLPLYENEATVEALVSGLARALGDGAWRPELVAVDDASGDRSSESLVAAARNHRLPCRMVRHGVNRGQNEAVMRGLAAAQADFVVVMDADLQDAPEDVPRLLAPLRKGPAELVFGRRVPREDAEREGLSSRALNQAVLWLAGSDLPPQIGLFCALTARARNRALARAAAPNHVVGLLASLGLPTSLVPVTRRPAPVEGSPVGSVDRARRGARALARAWHYGRRTASTGL